MIQSHKYLILLILTILTPGLKRSDAQQSVQCMAVITEIKGKAIYKEAGLSQFTKATWGTRLYNGDQVSTDDKSEIKLLYSDNSFVTVGPNSMITISDAEYNSTERTDEVKSIQSATGVNFSALTFKKVENKDVGALAGVRSGESAQAIDLESPYSTTIRTDRPAFTWSSKISYDGYTVNLYSSKGLVWSRKVNEPALQYPENEKGLEPGESYFWNVEGEYLINTDKSSNHKFTVLTSEKFKEVEVNESSIRYSFRDDPESSSLHSVLGAFYLDQGLFQDAITEFQIVSKINADAPMPHEILGSLYSEVGEKDRAIEELREALALTNVKNK
jgi:tetratricopeptide (TPR) repeat protein